MTTTTDQVLARRRGLGFGFLLGWTAWFGFLFGYQAGVFGAPFSGPVPAAAAMAGIAGWLAFVYFWVQLRMAHRTYRDDPAARAALEDERTARNKTRAAAFGFSALLATQLFLIATASQFDLSLAVGGQVSIFTGIFASMAAFLWLDARD